jgi:hypothetical protein
MDSAAEPVNTPQKAKNDNEYILQSQEISGS